MRKLLPFVFIAIVILVLFSFFFWFYEVKYFKSKASVKITDISVENSYLFVSPLQAKANGRERVRLTVFVLNNQGLGVQGQKVFVTQATHLNIEAISATTDNYGKAVFDITSITPGEYYLPVEVGGITLPQKAHLTFK